MKNIQVMDDAANTTFSLFQATDEELLVLFPEPGQDIEYAEDLRTRPDKTAVDEALRRLWQRPVRKQDAIGIHGTLLYQLQRHKRWYREKRAAVAKLAALDYAFLAYPDDLTELLHRYVGEHSAGLGPQAELTFSHVSRQAANAAGVTR